MSGKQDTTNNRIQQLETEITKLSDTLRSLQQKSVEQLVKAQAKEIVKSELDISVRNQVTELVKAELLELPQLVKAVTKPSIANTQTEMIKIRQDSEKESSDLKQSFASVNQSIQKLEEDHQRLEAHVARAAQSLELLKQEVEQKQRSKLFRWKYIVTIFGLLACITGGIQAVCAIITTSRTSNEEKKWLEILMIWAYLFPAFFFVLCFLLIRDAVHRMSQR
jgi:DNA repair exonuclease SbcCD ATPase subunit